MRGDKWLATTSVVRPPSRALALLCWPSAILVAASDQVSGRPSSCSMSPAGRR